MDKKVSVIIATYDRAKEVDLCVESILKSDYKNYEVIVVDNASTDNTVELLERKYKGRIKIIKSDKNLMNGGGRNLGAKHAHCDYLLFIDSDNIIDKPMIAELVKGAEPSDDVGMIGPLMYYLKDPNRIIWAGADINLWTSKVKYIGINEIDHGQYTTIRKVGHIPNIFMVKKSIWDEIGGIDKEFVMHYEDSDLAEKIRKSGHGVYIAPRAKTWHDVPLATDKSVRNYGGESIKRAYYTARNRILFIRKNASKLNLLVFILIFNNVFLTLYCLNYLRNRKLKSANAYLKGTVDGIFNRSRQI